MQERKEPGNNILQHMALDSQSTHNIAAQATAGRLLRLLEERYSLLVGADEPRKESQDKLLAYIEHRQAELIDKALAPAMIDEDLSSHPLIQLINIMLELSDDKQLLLTTLAVLVKNHPADVWTLYDEQWSKNKLYDATQRKIELVSASPAKTLSLVCAAILDNANHKNTTTDERNIPMSSSSVSLISDKQEHKRIRNMAKTLALCLVNLGKGAERNKCSGGRQHDLLWLLCGSYLDKEQRLFEFIDNLSVFLTMLLTSFIQTQLLPKATDDERINLVREWMIFSTIVDEMENPLLAMLERYHGESWRDRCNQWLSESCARVGISPEMHSATISSMANSLDELSIPIQNNPHAQLVWELYSTTPITRFTPSMQVLAEARNVAMQRFKTEVSAGNWNALEKNHQGIADLFTAETLFQSLQRYASMTLVGSGDNTILEAGLPMRVILLDFFSRYEIDILLPESFEQVKVTYLVQEKEFKEQSHEGIVTLFFQTMKTATRADFNNYWARIQAIPGLQLCDERINEILHRHFIDSRITFHEGLPHQLTGSSQTITLELSTYDINRLLLHGLHVAPRLWSETYKQTIASVCQWLLNPESNDDSIAMQAVKQSYPMNVLANFLLPTLLTGPLQALLSDQQDTFDLLYANKLAQYFNKRSFVCGNQLFSLTAPYFNVMVQNTIQLFQLFTLKLKEFDDDQRNQLWDAVKNKLPVMIKDSSHLTLLLGLNVKKFNEDKQTQLWDAIKNNLPAMVQNDSQLWSMFKLDIKRFTEEQRRQLWESIKDKLPVIIQSGSKISLLLDLDFKKFNSVQRNQLWESIRSNLPTLIQNGREIANLLELCFEKFDHIQRKELWEAVKNNFPLLIENDYQLYQILNLSLKQFDGVQRDQFWESIKNNLPALIQNGKWLGGLLLQLPFNKRSELWNSIKYNLQIIIQDGKQLRNLFALSAEKFDHVQRKELWEAVENNLSVIIQNGEQLGDLLELDFKNFNLAQRKQVWDALKNNLPALIQDSSHLSRLFRLDFDQLSADQRRQLWEAIEKNLLLIFRNGWHLDCVFSLNPDKFNEEQRRQVWKAIRNNLPVMITSIREFRALILLDYKKFGAEQRKELWEAIISKLPVLIKRSSELRSLLSLNLTQLDQTQRIQIFDSLKENGWPESRLNKIYEIYDESCSHIPLNVSVTTQGFFSSSSQPSCSTDNQLQPDDFNART